MRYVVTGGAGFIGSQLVRQLLDQEDFVAVLDDLSTGSLSNLAGLESHPRFEFHQGRADDPTIVNALARSCDGIFHLASVVGVRRVLDSPLRALREIQEATSCVLNAASTLRRRVVVTSSSEVYGKSTSLPLTEDQDLVVGASTKGRWAYATAKLSGEHLAVALHREEGLQVATARLFNTTGPRQVSHYGMVLPTFIDQAMSGEPITIIGDGSQSRCFTHVADVIRALSLLMSTDSCQGDIFNVGSSQRLTILALAKRVKEAAGSNSSITHLDPQSLGREFEDIPAREPDTSRIRSATGWQPEFDLNDIIKECIADRVNPMAFQ